MRKPIRARSTLLRVGLARRLIYQVSCSTRWPASILFTCRTAAPPPRSPTSSPVRSQRAHLACLDVPDRTGNVIEHHLSQPLQKRLPSAKANFRHYPTKSDLHSPHPAVIFTMTRSR